VLDRVVFLIRLHGHRLLPKRREASLVHGHIFFNAAPRILVVREPLLRCRNFLAGGFESHIKRDEPVRFASEPLLGIVRPRIESL
jgi:hypothetical protein